MREIKIYCPKCGWAPRPSSRWMCVPGCLWIWNTFDTCGVCPGCGKNWLQTKCLSCRRWSPHIDWYHEFGPAIEEKVEEHATATR